MQLEGTVVFVTGSNRGLGRSLVTELLARGVRRVYAASRGADPHTDPRVVAVRLDVTDAAQVRAAAEAAPDVELLINNAGRLVPGHILQSDPDHLRSSMDVNVHGTVAVSRAFVPVLEAAVKAGKPAAIANVLSVSALGNIPVVAGYAATKAALHWLTQSIRAELSSRGIRVHAAFPGTIDTDMTRGYGDIPKVAPEVVARAILDGVAADQEDIATDPMSAEAMALYARDPHELARRFRTP
jgi:NAD(P)-dependent dehydrogenase (short-subunit alcohol dehydrogenase family)